MNLRTIFKAQSIVLFINAIGGLLFTIIIAYHIMIGAVAGATAYVNIILTALFAIAFYFYSRD